MPPSGEALSSIPAFRFISKISHQLPRMDEAGRGLVCNRASRGRDVIVSKCGTNQRGRSAVTDGHPLFAIVNAVNSSNIASCGEIGRALAKYQVDPYGK